MEKILIIEDDKDINEMLQKLLKVNGYEVMSAYSGTEGVILHNKDISLIILDLMLPGKNGEEIIGELQAKSEVPIIVTTAIHDMDKKLDLFELGADDYVTKPFSPRELMLRVDAVLKRAKKTKKAEQNDVFTCEGLTVDFSARRVLVDGKEVEMTPKEYDLFFYMVRNRGIALSREKLISDVWGYDFYGDDRTLDTHVKLLRRSLGEYSRCIVTLRGVGYRFEA